VEKVVCIIVLLIAPVFLIHFLEVPSIFHYYRSNMVIIFISWELYILWVMIFVLLVIIILKNILLKKYNKLLILIQFFVILLFFISIVLYSYIFILKNGSNIIFFSKTDNLWLLWYSVYWFLSTSNLINIIFLIMSFLQKKRLFNKNNGIYLCLLSIEIILSILHVINKIPQTI
jgi:hypothetical protein